MKERPIIFSAPMVRAILDGRKTVTRRLVKPAAVSRLGLGMIGYAERLARAGAALRGVAIPSATPVVIPDGACPYGEIGDKLWVREVWAPADSLIKSGYECDPPEAVWYPADDAVLGSNGLRLDATGWTRPRKHSPIHMPRLLSRLTLEVLAVLPERLQSLSEEDARREGVEPAATEHGGYPGRGAAVVRHDPSFRREFEALWRRMHGDDAWDRDPWVWVIEFRRVP